MKIALIGYGRMGKTIEEVTLSRGHEIQLWIDKNNQEDLANISSDQIDVAIEFSKPESALNNVTYCLSAGIPVVSVSTGWNDQMAEAVKLSSKSKGAFFYASNFSVGVNIMFEINRRLAKIMNRFANYNVELKEIHHQP